MAEEVLDRFTEEELEAALEKKEIEEAAAKKNIIKDPTTRRNLFRAKISELNKAKALDTDSYCGYCGQTVPNINHLGGGE